MFHELLFERESSGTASPAFMIDQSHNLKGKMEAMVQTVVTAQELYAKAALIDLAKLADLQDSCRLVEAEEEFREAFWTDVRPLLRKWRQERGLMTDPLQALRESGYVERICEQRREKEREGSKLVRLRREPSSSGFIRGLQCKPR